MEAFKIRVLGTSDLEVAQAFLFEMVEVLFEKERDPKTHADIFEMMNFYFQNDEHTLIGAFDSEDHLVGTIAIKGFVDRFEVLKGRYLEKTAEVGRCYVDMTLRRQGLGKRLLEMAKLEAVKRDYKMLYLHTHPHLPGGYDFWLKSGFKVTQIEEALIPVIHMEYSL